MEFCKHLRRSGQRDTASELPMVNVQTAHDVGYHHDLACGCISSNNHKETVKLPGQTFSANLQTLSEEIFGFTAAGAVKGCARHSQPASGFEVHDDGSA